MKQTNKQQQTLPIWRDANRLLVAIEQAVMQFSRYHKYTLGSDLRKQAMGICRVLVRALNANDVNIIKQA